MNKVDFFIAGAPKSGTTSLFHYLQQHPQIFMPVVKEPNFFAADLPNYRAVSQLKTYHQLFSAASAEQTCWGEGSVWYLYSRAATQNIKEYNPDALFLVMLRNPVDMLYSLHQNLLFSFHEDESDFITAWGLQPVRSQGQRIPARCAEPAVLLYSQVARYGEQLERLYGSFPREQVKVVLFDDFVRDTRQVYTEVLSFLGVRDDGRTDFFVANQNRQWKKDYPLQWLVNAPPWLTRLAHIYKKIWGVEQVPFKRNLHEWVQAKGSHTASRTPLPEEFRQRLLREFADDIIRLEVLLERPTGWLTSGEGKE